MSTNMVYSSANNTYIPTFSPEASNALIVSYARDPKRFAVNRYTQVVQVDKQEGKYIRLNPYDASRLLSTDGSDAIWQDGADRPINSDQSFEYPLYATKRRSFGFHVGDLSAQQADWDVVAAKAATVASRMMLLQSASALTALTGSDMPTATGTTLGGGKWDVGDNATAAQNYFRRGVQAVAQEIVKATNGVVQAKDLIMIVNPVTASLLSSSLETVDLVKQSPYALDAYRNDNTLATWGLPSSVFGIGEVIVESAVKTTTKPKSAGTGTQSFVLADNAAIFCARPGAIEGQQGTFSTCHSMIKEEMTVETWSDSINRRQVGSVTSDFAHVIASPISGYYVTAITG